jgi:hypothetical protein
MRGLALFAAVTAAVVSLAVVVGVGGASGDVQAGEAGHQARAAAKRVVGTWVVDVRPTGQEPLQALLTLTPGGGLIETENTGPGTAQGTWRMSRRGRVALTFQRFEFDAQGAPAGRVVVRAQLNREGNGAGGPFEFEVFDAQGNVAASGSGSATAERYKVQPL